MIRRDMRWRVIFLGRIARKQQSTFFGVVDAMRVLDLGERGRVAFRSWKSLNRRLGVHYPEHHGYLTLLSQIVIS